MDYTTNRHEITVYSLSNLQGIKDYAEQQKRLQQDIKTYLDRNRDLAHKLMKEKEALAKAEAKILEHDQAQLIHEETTVTTVEQQLKASESALTSAEKDLISDENVYIPSEYKINRPKLLFLPENSPERDLESPACVQENISLLHPLQSVDQSDVNTLTLQPPLSSGQDLLSPQYCPKMTARKLFSVTRVTSPTLAPPANVLLDSSNKSLPVSHICTPLSSVPASSPLVSSLTIETMNLDTSSQVSVDSSLIQQKLENETLEAYIQDILETESTSQNLDSEVASYSKSNVDTSKDSVQLETEDMDVDTESDSLSEKTMDAKMDEIMTVLKPNKFSAGDGLGKDSILAAEKTSVNIQDSEIASGKTDATDVCEISDESNNAVLVADGGDNSINDSDTLKTSSGIASEIKSNEHNTVSQNMESKSISDKIQCKVDPSSTKENVIPSDSFTEDTKLENEESSDSHHDSLSIISEANDNQLDSIEIIPESDISEIKCDFNEELPELIDCDPDIEISNNNYSSLTDSLSDMILPFEIGNTNINVAKTSDNTECAVLNSNTKIAMETENHSLNSKTNGHHSNGPGSGEHDSEQWNKVEKSDICDKLIDQEISVNVVKPDFHTSLSLNGLKQELASLIDDDGNPTKLVSQTVAKSSISQQPIAKRFTNGMYCY